MGGRDAEQFDTMRILYVVTACHSANLVSIYYNLQSGCPFSNPFFLLQF